MKIAQAYRRNKNNIELALAPFVLSEFSALSVAVDLETKVLNTTSTLLFPMKIINITQQAYLPLKSREEASVEEQGPASTSNMALNNVVLISQLSAYVIAFMLSLCITIPMSLHQEEFR